jgi:hypothetical protein
VVAEDEKVIDDVPELKVRLVDVVKVTSSLNVTVLDPRLIALTLLLLDDKEPAVTL